MRAYTSTVRTRSPTYLTKSRLQRVSDCSAAAFLVAELDGQRAGFIRAVYDGSRAMIHLLSVRPACQRKGVGRALVEAMQAELQKFLKKERQLWEQQPGGILAPPPRAKTSIQPQGGQP